MRRGYLRQETGDKRRETARRGIGEGEKGRKGEGETGRQGDRETGRTY